MASNADLSRWAAELGHTGARVYPTASGARYIGECRCGLKTTTRRTEADAVGALIHHMHKVIKAAKTQGWTPAEEVRDTPSSFLSDRAASL